MKGSGAAAVREIDRHADGVGWIAYPDEQMQRASHAIRIDGEVWVFDPVDGEGVDELLASLDAPVAGVVVCLDRHERDAAAVARRHEVSVHAPSWMTGVAPEGVRLERFGEQVAEGLRAIRVRDSRLPPWQEVALYAEASGTLYVPETVGTSEYMVTDDETLGVHPMLRLFPPKTLGGVEPERVVVGHGEGVGTDETDETNASTALQQAFRESRSNTLSLYAKTARSLFG